MLAQTSRTLHSGLDLQRDVSAILAATSQSLDVRQPSIEFASEAYIARKQRSSPVYLHAALTFIDPQQVNAYFLLVDRAEGSAGMWQAHLRCLDQWAKRTPSHFPPLLIISPNHFRAGAMLRLARTTCKTLTVVATGRRDIALNEGLLAISKHKKGWFKLMPNNRLALVDPFAWPAMPREAYEQSSFAISKLKCSAEKSTVGEISQSDLETINRFEKLSDCQHQLLAFLCRNPVIPETVLSTFLSLLHTKIQNDLFALEQAGFTQRIQSKISESIWAASDTGAELRFLREMQPANHLRRYRFFRADHERRLLHTLGVYRFFESIHLHCDRRSRATRKLDAKAGSLNEGNVPAFALKAWESEFMASDWYVARGQMRFWRPDGYGAVRAGKAVTHFWLELDGTASAPSRFDSAIWMGKLGRLCDYVQSGRWTFRYPKLPRLLIVTTDLRNVTHIYDALVESAQARGLRKWPLVLVADSAAIQQRGPLAKVWLDVAEDESWCHAFDGLEAIRLQTSLPQRTNVLDELQRAEALGLPPFGED